MQTTYLRNSKSQLIAMIQIDSNGIKRLRDTKGTLLGWYDPSIDKTISARTGNWVGLGDTLLTLL